jgi:hypothetical protein
MLNRQYANPLIICSRDGKESVHKLFSVPRDEQARREQWFQDKLFSHPYLLPASEIEPAFHNLEPIASYWADLLLVNPDGCIALVETKLFRNAEARRGGPGGHSCSPASSNGTQPEHNNI